MREDKKLLKIQKINKKFEKKYESKKKMKKRFKNSTCFTNIKYVDDDGLIHLKSGEVACLLEIQAIDLSLTSNFEKDTFFNMLKSLYQIPNLNMKCYKVDEKLNLNSNKDMLDKRIEESKQENKRELIQDSKDLINSLENDGLTISSKYFWVVIAKDVELLDKQIEDIEDISFNLNPKLYISSIINKLEIYKFLSNLYLTTNSLDELIWSDIPALFAPMNISEKIDKLKFDEKEVQMITIKNIPPFENELFFEGLFNYPGIRVCLQIKECITQEELINWVNREYQFLLTDRNTTKKLSDATELDTQKEKYQVLMNDITNGDEKIKLVNLVIAIEGDKKTRDLIISDLKKLANIYKIKLDIPRLRQAEAWQSYDITNKSFNDYSFYLPTLSLSAGFPFTKTNFNDSSGYMLGVDIHTSLPIFFDPFALNNSRTSHNLAIISSTGGGKSYTMKKMIVDEFARGTKIFIFDAENEYKKIIESNNGEYINLFSASTGIINPLQIRFIPSDSETSTKETECPLPKHISYLESFFKSAFEDITDEEVIELTRIIEKLYNEKNIFSNTSINTLETLSPKDYPTFSELYKFIGKYKSDVKNKEELKMIEKLEVILSRFVTGTDAYLFDGYTNIDLSNDLVGFNLQELLYSNNPRLINTQLLNIISYLNNSIVSNKIKNDKTNNKKHIMICADEFHLFIDEENPEVLKNFGQLARRIRKYSGSLVVATQSIKDFVGNNNILRHSTAIFNNCQYQMVGMLKEDDMLAYLELFKENPLTDTQKNFLLDAKQGQFLLNIDSKNRLRIWIQATELERKMMGEGGEKDEKAI